MAKTVGKIRGTFSLFACPRCMPEDPAAEHNVSAMGVKRGRWLCPSQSALNIALAWSRRVNRVEDGLGYSRSPTNTKFSTTKRFLWKGKWRLERSQWSIHDKSVLLEYKLSTLAHADKTGTSLIL